MATSRSAAQHAIAAGHVLVSGVPEPKPSTMVSESDSVTIDDAASRFVGRGGQKLDAALSTFPIDVTGKRAVDVGASTGGFTDCLLQRGAAAVATIDVGYGQLDWRLRTDPRVAVHERTNVRLADAGALGAPFDVVVADLSFISLRTVAPQLGALGSDDADWVLLVKPQFEVGRRAVPKGGVVLDPSARARAVRQVRDALAEAGIGAAGLIRSPIKGATGNVEYLLWARRGPATVGDEAVDAITGSGP